MNKIFIKNRKKQKISVLVEKNLKQKELVFIMHGLGGYKEQPQMQAMRDAFYENNFTVIRFDTSNTFGESDGGYEDATTTNYYEDLEDVLNWSEKQSWYQEPFYLVGHSLGAMCVALFAEKHPEKIKGLAPISVAVSGKLSMSSPANKDILENWKKVGWKEEENHSKPGIIKKLKWSHMEDRLKYDLLEKVDRLTMPVLLIVGSLDTHTPVEHQKILFDKLPGKKELHIINGSEHTFRGEKYFQELKKLFLKWIKNIDKI